VLSNQVQTHGRHPSAEKGSCDDSQLKNYPSGIQPAIPIQVA